MKSKKSLSIHKKNVFSSISWIKDTGNVIGNLKTPFFMNSGYYYGKERYLFLPIDFFANTYRVYRSGKSRGYIHFHGMRNLAQLNLVEEGPYQFSLRGIFTNNWVLRQGNKSIESERKNLFIRSLETDEEEMLLACGLFINAKIKKDLLGLTPVFLLLLYMILIF